MNAELFIARRIYKGEKKNNKKVSSPAIKIAVTGIALGLDDPHYAAFIHSRSGLAIKHGIRLLNSVGVIDSDYRGEVCVGVIKQTEEPYTIQPFERIAQMVIKPVELPEIIEVEELDETDRGAGGFGSTGKK